MDQKKIVKEQLLHLAFGAVFFLALGALAVLLDLAAIGVLRLGVSSFTANSLGFAAHTVLVLDLVLFFAYLIATSIELIKGMTK